MRCPLFRMGVDGVLVIACRGPQALVFGVASQYQGRVRALAAPGTGRQRLQGFSMCKGHRIAASLLECQVQVEIFIPSRHLEISRSRVV